MAMQEMRAKDLETGEASKVSIETPFGTIRGKYYIRAATQSVAFACLLAGYGAVHMYKSAMGSAAEEEDLTMRLLQEANATASPTESDPCADLKVSDPGWLCIFYAIGVAYTFLALAIACDEFFVPALEEMSGPRRLNLSMDVAGATLMAAGGSAPELFTALFGTFAESAIGFGTIVGSAVFNVLFVIAMCSLLAKEVLSLTWWPLFRDSICYSIGLGVLAVFVGVITPDVIELWEALILFFMYLVYILIMWQNGNIYKAITGKVLEYPDEDEEDKEESKAEEAADKASVVSSAGATPAYGGDGKPRGFLWHGTFRAGILKLLKDPQSWLDTAGVGIVSKIAGDATYVYQQVDVDNNGHIDREELKQLFNLLECYISPKELEEVFVALDEDGDGTISQKEFTDWYLRSEQRILSQVRHVFDEIDSDKSNAIDKDELKTLLTLLDAHVTDEDVKEAMNAMYEHGSRDEITFEEFSTWYKTSIMYQREQKMVDEDIAGVWDNLYPPKDGSFGDWLWYIVVLPLVFCMTITIPDVRRPGLGKWCYFSFFMSIAWIGGFSYFMVDWAETIGNTIGIPAVIMGLTILAAGTSVPDLLSSVIVARRGNGDMAVSSSIGSNIFDILVGLPLPWVLFILWPDTKDQVNIGSDGIFLSLFLLLAMLIFVILSVNCQGWKLTKTLGYMMLVFYVGFLIQAIVQELPFVKC